MMGVLRLLTYLNYEIFKTHSTLGCVYLTHILQKPCSTTTMAVYAIYEATAKKLEFASGKSRLATLF